MAQLGSALDWGSRGRRFKSCQPDHEAPENRRNTRNSGAFFMPSGGRNDRWLIWVSHDDASCTVSSENPLRAGARYARTPHRHPLRLGGGAQRVGVVNHGGEDAADGVIEHLASCPGELVAWHGTEAERSEGDRSAEAGQTGRTLTRYLIPLAWTRRRTRSSGFVSRPLLLRIERRTPSFDADDALSTLEG